MILVTACSQNDEVMNEVNNSALAQAEMTYEQYLKGYTLEEMMAPKDEKTPTKTPETVADEELMQLLQDSLEGTYSKTRVRTRAISELLPYMGVFKMKTCGNYPELQVFMDCEDGGDWARVEGVGGLPPDKNFPYTYFDGNRNVWMTFCLVMADQTYMVPKGYGALYLVGGNASLIASNADKLIKEGNDYADPNNNKNWPRMTFIERFHDNEDHNNKNTAKYKGGTLNWIYNPFADKYPDFTPKPSYVAEKNTLLTWMFPECEPRNVFHPGFSYGVIAPSTSNSDCNFKIHIDDENGKNSNYIKKVMWDRRGTGYLRSNINVPSGYSPVVKGIQFTENTVYCVKSVM